MSWKAVFENPRGWLKPVSATAQRVLERQGVAGAAKCEPETEVTVTKGN
ncbi:MAG: hypothetical protein AMXMBFR58_38440 [Phycisphaerae bacterium]